MVHRYTIYVYPKHQYTILLGYFGIGLFWQAVLSDTFKIRQWELLETPTSALATPTFDNFHYIFITKQYKN